MAGSSTTMKALTPTISLRKRKNVTRAGSVLVLGWALGLLAGTAQEKPFAPPPMKVAEGFEVSLAAAPPLVNYPMMACLDDEGRLYIAESDGRNLNTRAEIEKELPRFVRRLVDTDRDGVFDQSTIFADKMTMPEGGLWHEGALYIISAPYLWRLEDTDDDGVADKREKILGSMEFDGRANQHGPYLGPNGRLYFTGGVFGYELVGTDGSRTGKGRAAGVFSCRPDGSEVRVDGQGGINPVDVAFTRSGEMLSTCAIFDSYGGKRHDALIHWVRGGLTQRVYGVPLLPETGHRLPALSRWGQVAPAGLVRYRGEHFGAESQDTLFACHFNTNKVVHARLVPGGATFTTEESDFLTSPSIDFHPADILEDADGSLLLLDTGGWLSWGCPHSKIAKPEVRGAIYRIRRKGGANVPDPRGRKINWKKLPPLEVSNLLADHRPAVRDRAQALLLAMGPRAVPGVVSNLENDPSPAVRQRCVWTLSQIDSREARAMVRAALLDQDAGVRSAAARSVGELQDKAAAPALLKLLDDESPAVRRAAATALGQIGDHSAVPALFDALQPGTELYLQHAVTYALIEIADSSATLPVLGQGDHPHRQRAALRVLDQASPESLEPSMVVPFLQSAHPALRDEARRVVSGRPGWRNEVMQVFRNLLDGESLEGEAAQLLEGIVLTFAEDDGFHGEISRTLVEKATPVTVKTGLLTAIGFMEALPESLHPAIRSALTSSSPSLVSEALAVVLRFGAGGSFAVELEAMGSGRDVPAALRVAALEAMAQHHKALADDAFTPLLEVARDPASSALLRRQAARALGRLELVQTNQSQAHRLCELIAAASPLQVPFLLQPFENLAAQDWPADRLEALGLKLAAALAQSPARASLRPAQITRLLERFPPSTPNTLAALRELSTDDASGAAERESKLVALLEFANAGNASRGRILFHAHRATCALCHRIDGQGGSLGPNLSKIGGIRSRKDLLEAIVFPSATVVNGFESYVLTGPDGVAHTGLLQRETPEAVYLRDAGQRLQRIPREQITSMVRSPVSAMPAGLEGILSALELADLVAFLETCR